MVWGNQKSVSHNFTFTWTSLADSIPGVGGGKSEEDEVSKEDQVPKHVLFNVNYNWNFLTFEILYQEKLIGRQSLGNRQFHQSKLT